MEYSEVKEWLDILVKRFKIATQTEHLSSRIYAQASGESSIMIYQDLDVVADIMGLEIIEKYSFYEVLNEHYYRYSFVYDGVEFVTLQEERMERFAIHD